MSWKTRSSIGEKMSNIPLGDVTLRVCWSDNHDRFEIRRLSGFQICQKKIHMMKKIPS